MCECLCVCLYLFVWLKVHQRGITGAETMISNIAGYPLYAFASIWILSSCDICNICHTVSPGLAGKSHTATFSWLSVAGEVDLKERVGKTQW